MALTNQLMNQATSHLASRGELQRATEKESFFFFFFKGGKGVEKKEITSKESIILGEVSLPRKIKGAHL